MDALRIISTCHHCLTAFSDLLCTAKRVGLEPIGPTNQNSRCDPLAIRTEGMNTRILTSAWMDFEPLALPATSLGVPVIGTGTSKWLSSDVSVRYREDDTLQHRQFLCSLTPSILYLLPSWLVFTMNSQGTDIRIVFIQNGIMNVPPRNKSSVTTSLVLSVSNIASVRFQLTTYVVLPSIALNSLYHRKCAWTLMWAGSM